MHTGVVSGVSQGGGDARTRREKSEEDHADSVASAGSLTASRSGRQSGKSEPRLKHKNADPPLRNFATKNGNSPRITVPENFVVGNGRARWSILWKTTAAISISTCKNFSSGSTER